MKFNLKTDIVDSKIFQDITYECEDRIVEVSKRMCDAQEEQFKKALVKLGWTSPTETRNIRV